MTHAYHKCSVLPFFLVFCGNVEYWCNKNGNMDVLIVLLANDHSAVIFHKCFTGMKRGGGGGECWGQFRAEFFLV